MVGKKKNISDRKLLVSLANIYSTRIIPGLQYKKKLLPINIVCVKRSLKTQKENLVGYSGFLQANSSKDKIEKKPNLYLESFIYNKNDFKIKYTKECLI